MMIALFAILGIVVILIATAVLTSLYINAPTKGTPIDQYENPRAALLVIDVQNDTTGTTGFYGDTTEFVANVNQAISFAHEKEMEILYVKNEYGNNPIVSLLSMGKYRKGTNGAELDNRLQVVNENVFSKSIGDSFSSKDFEEYLISKEIDTLYIVGADASACIYSTARGGTNRHYNVNVIKEAIITINEKTMTQMLTKYASDDIKVIDLLQFQEIVQSK